MQQADTLNDPGPPIARELAARFRSQPIKLQPTCDGISTFWIEQEHLAETLHYLKFEAENPYQHALRSNSAGRTYTGASRQISRHPILPLYIT